MKIFFEGHACIRVEGSLKILIDPFITGNDLAKIDPNTIEADYILVTHAHGDHLGDTIDIAKRTGATVVAVNELALYLEEQGLKVHPMNIGGAYDFGNLKVKVTQAWHTSTLPDGTACSAASGFLFWLDGNCFYHAGDTGLFGDMGKVIGKHDINLAFLPIGGNFTMGPVDALTAVGWLGCKAVVPIHYDTFPVIKQDPNKFKEAVENRTDSKCIVMEPHSSFVL